LIIFTGEPGSTKTTHIKVLRSFTDPNAVPVRSPPRDQRDIYIVANKSAMVVYNNLSYLPDWLSDGLCLITEGSGDSRRELYTDDDESLIYACVPAMIAAVDNIITRGDLADSTLYASLAAVPPEERMAEPEFWKWVKEEQPAILGALLNALSTGLKRLPTLQIGALPRMATFAKWVTACETEFWEEGAFLRAYMANADSADVDVLESDAAVATFCAFMADLEQWSGTATQLLEELTAFVRRPEREAEAAHRDAVERGKCGDTFADQARAATLLREARDRVRETLSGRRWSKKPHFLTGRLRKCGPQLRRVGISITWPMGHHYGRIVTILKTSPRSSAKTASPASPAPRSESASNENNGLGDSGSKNRGRSQDAAGRSGRKTASRITHWKKTAIRHISRIGTLGTLILHTCGGRPTGVAEQRENRPPIPMAGCNQKMKRRVRSSDLKAIYAYLRALPAANACNTVADGCPPFSGAATGSATYVYTSTPDCPNPPTPQ
jgi:hypothetical protein